MGMSERRSHQLIERREKILDNALRLFREEGYETTTMQDIADASELSKGSLYLQFENKEALIVALLERTFDKLEGIIEKEAATRVARGRDWSASFTRTSRLRGTRAATTTTSGFCRGCHPCKIPLIKRSYGRGSKGCRSS